MPTKKNTDQTTETIVQETAPVDNTSVWTDPKDYGPDNGGNNILAAWQGLYWLFDARVERFDVTHDGVFAIGFRVNDKYDPDTIVKDISMRGGKTVERRLELVPSLFYVQGQEPPKFEDSASMTQFMAQYARGSGDGDGNSNRSPEYFKTAIAEYKKVHGFTARRGRPPKTFKIESIGDLDPAILSNIDPHELQKLKETLDKIMTPAS